MKKIFLLIMFIGAVTSVNAQDLVATVTVSAVTCNGQCNGVITVEATGGGGNYSYELYASGIIVVTSSSSTFTDLCSGNYIVHVKDSSNNEYVTNSVTIAEPSALVLTNTVTQEPSNGNNDGEIILYVTGGVPPYEYSIDGGGVFTSSNIFSNLSIGTYVFTVRDQLGCFTTNEVILEYSIPDTDGDGENDSIDLDDDNDGNPDGTDVNPLIPTVADDVLTVTEGTTGVVNVLTNDDFLPGANTSLSVVSGAGTTAGGTIIFDSLTGEMSYTSAAGEEGTTVTVEYQVCNTAVIPSICKTAIVTITVQVDTDGDSDPNITDPDDDNDGNPDGTDANPLIPTVADDVLTVTEGTTGVVNVLTNDDFLPGVNTGLSVVAGAGTTAGGTIIFDPLTGEMSYIAAAGEEGTTVTVEYQVCNTVVIPSICETATVTVIIQIDTDGDGITDINDIDDDNDGISDSAEGIDDTDGDGIPNYLDLDTDNDGVLDVDEGGNGALDTNSDGIIDFYDAGFTDANGDGQADESAGVNNVPDTDGDGVPDYKDLDSDNDGINDVIEDGNIDANNDGKSDGVDLDGDGILESVDADESGFGEGINGESDNTDTDSDGVPNYHDLDSDDDGINDVVEGGNDDTDGNGLIDGEDNDGDGILDIVDQDSSSFGDAGNTDTNNTASIDSNNGGTGIVSDSGTDIDGDGIADSVDGDDAIFGDKKEVNLGGKSEIKGYPNPSSKEINLPQKAEGKTYEIFNSLGIVVKKGIVSNLKIDIEKMSNGIYFLKINGYDSFKLVKG